jgi:predicted nucleic-acid-binding protein
MIAFDTNILIRLLVNDNQIQADIAQHLLETNNVFISRTVLLETEWVLRSIYKKSRNEIYNFLSNALNTENLYVENSNEVQNAIEWYKLGADFADAIHLCVCNRYKIYTFDSDFCKIACRLGITPEINVLKN